MKKILLLAGVALLMGACAKEKVEVDIKLPKDYKEKTLVVSHLTLNNIYSATSQDDLKLMYDTLEVNNGRAILNIDEKEPSWYNILPPMVARMQPEFYASPGESLDVTIKSFEPLDYEVKGSPLMEDLMKFYSIITPIQQEYAEMVSASDSIAPEKTKALWDRYDAAVKKFIAENPKSQALPIALVELGADDFKQAYDNLTPEAKRSILMPHAESMHKQVEQALKEQADEQARKEEVAAGNTDAPNFTLPDLNGKMVSLSDFRGKWVVLDFWGSWCGWCIKGFPALKEAYEKYGDKLVVIGIDCNESEAEWREGVKKHQIPWLNLYNGHGNELYLDYKIEGFPTKAIINPEGKLVDLTTGEDPDFYKRLGEFMK